MARSIVVKRFILRMLLGIRFRSRLGISNFRIMDGASTEVRNVETTSAFPVVSNVHLQISRFLARQILEPDFKSRCLWVKTINLFLPSSLTRITIQLPWFSLLSPSHVSPFSFRPALKLLTTPFTSFKILNICSKIWLHDSK